MRLQDRAHGAFVPGWVCDNTLSSDVDSYGLREASARNLPAEIDEIPDGRKFMEELHWFLVVTRGRWDGVDMAQVEDDRSDPKTRTALMKAGWIGHHRVGDQHFWYFTRKGRCGLISGPQPDAAPQL